MVRDASVSCPIARKDFMIDGGEQLLVSHLCTALACTHGDYICGCLHVEGKAAYRQRWAAFAVWFCIWLQRPVPASLHNFHVCLEELVNIHPCEIQVQSVLPRRTEMCLNDGNGAKRADLICHAFKDAKDKTDKQGLDKVIGWIGCSRQWHSTCECYDSVE